ncbi:MAG: nitrate reductase cytochrome c-type subunit [Pseudomonadota bacterium]
MKKISPIAIALTFIVSGLCATAFAQEPMSLRGHVAADDLSEPPAPKRWQSDREPIPRDYLQQPPLIPHSIEGYKVNLKFNKCLTCHSWSNYRRAGATKISQTHFEDRDLHVMANVSARRYFCSQCHVSQMDTDPLVENTFEPVKVLKEAR